MDESHEILSKCELADKNYKEEYQKNIELGMALKLPKFNHLEFEKLIIRPISQPLAEVFRHIKRQAPDNHIRAVIVAYADLLPILLGAVLCRDHLKLHRGIALQLEFTLSTDLANSDKVCTPAIDNAERELPEKGEYRKGKARQ